MRTLATTLALLLSSTVWAAPMQYTLGGPATATFNFRVTLVPVPGESRGLEGSLTFDPENLQHTRGHVQVDLRTLNTGILLRDQHARKYLGVQAHPHAHFKVSRITGIHRLAPGQDLQGFAEGTFSLNGIARPLKAPIRVKFDRQVLTVHTRFDVVLRDHQIQIPGADPTTDVTVTFQLKPLK